MKKTLENIDWSKVLKVIIVGGLVIVIAIGMTVVLKHSIFLSILASGDVVVEGAKFFLK